MKKKTITEKKFAEFAFCEEEQLVCTAIHNGHRLSKLIAENMLLSETERLYEEDPYTGYFTSICRNRIVVNQSRFEVDLNRQRNRAFYLNPEQAWGLKVRKNEPDQEEINIALQEYDMFYAETERFIGHLLNFQKRIFVFDLHSYNHQRQGTGKAFDDPQENPEIILGTNNMPEKFYPLVEMVRNTLTKQDYFGRSLDVRINVKFDGGHFSRWLHSTFQDHVICIALEFKKIFMDEWSGKLYRSKSERLKKILSNALPGIRNFLQKL